MTWIERTSRRLGLDPRAGIGAAVLIGGTFIWVLAFTGGFSGLFKGSTRTVTVEFANTQALVKHDPVRVKGVQVGSVARVQPDGKGRGGIVTIKLTRDTGELYADAHASILWRTALGANEAIELDPGTRAAGELPGGRIPRSQTASQIELDEITRALNGGAAQGLRTTLKELGPAFSAENALGKSLDTLADVAPSVTKGVGALRGRIPDRDLQDLVSDTAKATQALAVGTSAGTTRRFVESAATTLSAMSASAPELRRSMSSLATTLPHAGRTLTKVDATLDDLDPLTAKLRTAAPSVAPALRDLRPAVVKAGTLLRDAKPLLTKLRPAVSSLAATGKVGTKVIDELKPSLERLDNKVLPTLAEDTPETRGHPAYTMFGAALGGLGPISHAFDINGPQVNLTAGLMEPQGAQVLPCTEDFSGTPFLVCKSLSEALSATFGAGAQALQNLVPLPGPVEKLLGGKVDAAEASVRRFRQTKQDIRAKDPDLARRLFDRQLGAPKP